jgi:hypothetical protein
MGAGDPGAHRLCSHAQGSPRTVAFLHDECRHPAEHCCRPGNGQGTLRSLSRAGRSHAAPAALERSLDRDSVERRRAGRAGFSLTNKAPTARSTARRRGRAPLCRWAVPAGEAPPPESTPHWILDCPGPRVDGIPSLGRGQGHAAVGNGIRPPAPPLALGGPGAGPLTAYLFAASGFIQSGPASSRTRARGRQRPASRRQHCWSR